MASQLHLQLCTQRNFGNDGALASVFTEISDVQTIAVDGTNKTSTLVVTEAMEREHGGLNRLFWRLVLHGDVAARVAHAATPLATGNRAVVMLPDSELFVGVAVSGEKIGVTNQAEPA